MPSDDLIDEAAIAFQVAKVLVAAQKQGIFDRLLQMAVGTLDRPVLMRDAGLLRVGIMR